MYIAKYTRICHTHTNEALRVFYLIKIMGKLLSSCRCPAFRACFVGARPSRCWPASQEGYGFVPSDGDPDDDDDDGYMYEDENDDAVDEGEGEGYDGPNQHPGGLATEAAGAAAGGEAAPAEGGAAADAAAREQTKKRSKKKSGRRPGVVEQLKAKASGGSADGPVAQGGGSGKGEEGGGMDASPPEMGLLDAVAAMILGERFCFGRPNTTPRQTVFFFFVS